ncbi:MAG: Uma2 family endonuclease [Cytophagales bacterium]
MNMIAEMGGTLVLDTHSLGGFTDEEFYNFCLDNRDLKFERDAQTNIIVMSNTGGKTGYYNTEVLADLAVWNRKMKKGVCFDSSTAFKLPSTAVRSPDAAWVQNERWNALTDREKEQFPPLCPDFVIEIKSATDSLVGLKTKMKEWIENGCRLAWLISPEERLTYIYSASVQHTKTFEEILSGETILAGFEIDLSAIFS